MRERYGDEDVAEWLCLYSVEARIMYMDENILSILQVEETRTERGGWRYFGCTFDLNTGELLKLTDLVDGDLSTLTERLRATVETAQGYTSFAGIANDMVGEVKFIYRTDSIG